jgi:hypothetical protein
MSTGFLITGRFSSSYGFTIEMSHWKTQDCIFVADLGGLTCLGIQLVERIFSTNSDDPEQWDLKDEPMGPIKLSNVKPENKPWIPWFIKLRGGIPWVFLHSSHFIWYFLMVPSLFETAVWHGIYSSRVDLFELHFFWCSCEDHFREKKHVASGKLIQVPSGK